MRNSVLIRATAATVAIFWAGSWSSSPAVAQTAALEEVVVTGSRILRDGFEAPTPLTVLSVEELQAEPRQDLAETVNMLPSFVGSVVPVRSTIPSGLPGVNALNLRGMGTIRTLVLLDGKRSPGADPSGIVDISDFPQELVSRVDVVTGGASAAYGSDAITGVVNFILNKDYVGVKGDVSGGITAYGDNKSFKASFGAGTGFAGDRGHILVSGEISTKENLPGSNRDWMAAGRLVIQNPTYSPTNGQPQYLLTDNVGPSQAVPGGIITNTALRGTTFGVNGEPRQFRYGVGLGTYMSGGDWESLKLTKNGTLDPKGSRRGIFTRVSYDLTDTVEAYAQLSWGTSRAKANSGQAYFNNTFPIASGNPFIPPTVQAQMTALGIAQFTMGFADPYLFVEPEFNNIFFDNRRTAEREIVGLTGAFNALRTDWRWDVYAQRGVSTTDQYVYNIPINDNFNKAIDAVRHPTTGAVVCRVTLSDPTDPCVPFNLMGINMNSQRALSYVLGRPYISQTMKQSDAGATVSGDPFSTWAGPVSLAFGGEWRRESVSGGPANSGYFSANFNPTFGSYTVVEGFLETVVPLAKDVLLARHLDLNAAVRSTRYSTSGNVITWKVGTTWQIVDGLRLRGTLSRDIRAPNLGDLYAGGTSSSGVNTRDPFRNNMIVPAPTFSSGNPDLTPERALTKGFGAVFQPAFLQGFSTSVDYWNIDLKNVIGNLNGQQLLDQCFLRGEPYCSLITRDASMNITSIRVRPLNFSRQIWRGIDVEASYRQSLGAIFDGAPGDLTQRALGTHYLKTYTNNTVTPPTDTAGSLGTPDWLFNVSLTYGNGPLRATLGATGHTGGPANRNWIECSSGCPAATVNNPTINVNEMPGSFILNGSMSYDVRDNWTVYLSVQNLLDKDPPAVPDLNNRTPTDFPTNAERYPIVGRAFRVGFRFQP